MLAHDDYASEPRALLARLDAHLAELGYDAAAHDKARLEEDLRRPADVEHRRLEAATAALVPLDKEIADLEAQITERAGEIERQTSQLAALQLSLAEAARDLPDLAVAEHLLFDMQEQENHLTKKLARPGSASRCSMSSDSAVPNSRRPARHLPWLSGGIKCSNAASVRTVYPRC